MTDFITNHYDLDEARGKTLLVLDAFKSMARAVDNDVIPGSREDVIISGIENPASTLSSTGNQYTTIPLRPVSKDVNFLFHNVVHGRFEFQFRIDSYSDAGTTHANLAQPLHTAISMVNTAAFFNRLQLRLGNSIVWQNQFQRQEAICGMASLPQEIIETSPEFLTCSKVLNESPIPGIYWSLTTNPTSTGIHTKTAIIDFTVDLNHLSPIISNIPFTTAELGDLNLRVFTENLHECFAFVPIPTVGQSSDPILSNPSFHVISPQPLNKLIKIYQPETLAYTAGATATVGAGVATSAIYLKASLVSWRAVDFGIELVQSCFSLKQASVDMLKSYIADDNRIIIPTQTWSTAVSTNPLTSATGELIFQLSAQNIYLLAFLFPYNTEWSCYYPTPPFTGIDIQLNSKSINYLPYKAIDSRVMKDTIQAFMNDDRYGANENLLNSLQMPIDGAGYNATAYLNRFSNANHRYDTLNPNCFLLAKGLSPPSSFEKGYCYASSNPQSTQVRFKYALQSGLETGADNTLNANMSLTSTNSPAYCMALQDCCLVLNYNPVSQRADNGSIVYAEPKLV